MSNKEIKEQLVGLYFPVLDGNGFVALTDTMGDDKAIENAARTSYTNNTRKVSDTRALLRRLFRDRHDSPFEFAELQFHVRAPLYVIQQWLRHRTNSFCQESFRYSEVKTDFETTLENGWRLQSKTNKQGSENVLTEWPKQYSEEFENLTLQSFNAPTFESGPGAWLSYRQQGLHNQMQEVYEERLKLGIAREQARVDIPDCTYSTLCIKTDLRNLLHFLQLRLASDAQKEIREYANVIAGIVKLLFPIVWEAFVDYSFCSSRLSRLDLDFLEVLNYYNGSWDDKRKQFEQDGLVEERSKLKGQEYESFWEKVKGKKPPVFELDLSQGQRKLDSVEEGKNE